MLLIGMLLFLYSEVEVAFLKLCPIYNSAHCAKVSSRLFNRLNQYYLPENSFDL